MELHELQERIQRWKQRNALPAEQVEEEGNVMVETSEAYENQYEEEQYEQEQEQDVFFDSNEEEEPQVAEDSTGEISTEDIYEEETEK